MLIVSENAKSQSGIKYLGYGARLNKKKSSQKVELFRQSNKTKKLFMKVTILMVNLSHQPTSLKKEKNHYNKTHKSISNFLTKTASKISVTTMKDSKDIPKLTTK